MGTIVDTSKIFLYIPPMLLVIGNIGNLLSLITFSRPKFQGTTSGIMYRALAVCDLLVLNSGLWDFWFGHLQLHWLNVRAFTDWTCTIFFYVQYLCKSLGGWIILMIGIERMVAVTVPYKIKIWFNQRKTLIQLLLTTLILGVLYIPGGMVTFRFSMEDAQGKIVSQFCSGKYDGWYYGLFYDLHTYVDLIVYAAVPSILMFLCNIIISVSLTTAAVKRKSLGAVGGPKITSLTTALIVVSTFYLVLSLPVTFVQLFAPVDFMRSFREELVSMFGCSQQPVMPAAQVPAASIKKQEVQNEAMTRARGKGTGQIITTSRF